MRFNPVKSVSRALAVILLTAVCCMNACHAAQPSVDFRGVDVDSLVRAVARENSMSPLCGIWRATVDGAAIGIVPAEGWRRATGGGYGDGRHSLAERWLMVVVESPSPRLQPGTVMGMMTAAAKPGHYNAEILTEQKGGTLRSPRRFVMNLRDDGHLTMRAIHKGLEVNPWRFLPYMIKGISLRGVLNYRDDTPADLDGFLKEWPVARSPQNPRYL